MRIAVIIASRLQALPGGGQGELYLHRSIASVRRQTVAPTSDMEVVVGLDPGVRLAAPLPGVVTVNAAKARQACAINAAVAASRGELLAILEDDDVWHRRRLEYGLRCLDRADLVTSNQLEVDAAGKPMQVNDYPTPSGWLLPCAVWERVGPFDESFSFPDSEYLGRVHMQRLRRLHLVEARATVRPGLGNVARIQCNEINEDNVIASSPFA
jgi:hypothetical protein